MTTRAELLADLDSWLARDDLSAGGEQTTILRIAQAIINRRVRTSDLELVTTLVCTGRTTALPTGCLGIVSLTLDSSLDRTVQYLTPERIREAPIWNNQGGGLTDNTASAYTIEAKSITLAPAPTVTAPVTLDLVIYSKLSDLVNDSDTNDLLTNNYDLYLWALLEAAAVYLEDTELQLKYNGLFSRTLTELERSENMLKFPLSTDLIATGHPRAVV